MRPLLMLSCALLLLPLAARADEAAEKHRAAQQLAGQGSDAWERHDYERALERFREAYAVFPSPKLHYNIALAFGALGRAPEAVAEYEAFLDEARDAPASALAAARAQVAELDRSLGRVLLLVDVDGAEVLVDDRPIGRTPLRHPPRASPGTHRLSIRHAGFTAESRSFALSIGQARRIEIHLAIERRAAGVERESRGRWLIKRWWFWTAVGAVVSAGVVAGAVLGAPSETLDSKLGSVRPCFGANCP